MEQHKTRIVASGAQATGALEGGPGLDGRRGVLAGRGVGDLVMRYGLVGLLAIEIIIFAVWIPDRFLTTANFQSVVSSQAILMVVTLGVALPIIVGEFDISVAGTLSLCVTLVGYLTVQQGWPLGAALVLVLAVAVAVGALNALLIVRLQIDSIVATLGTGTMLGGLSLMISQSALITGIPQPLVDVSTKKLVGLPLPVFYGLALAFVIWIVLEHSPLGRRLVFSGAGRDAARLSGIKVDRQIAAAFVGSAVLAGLAGVLLAGQLGTADPTAGTAFLLPSIAGVFLGATAFTPGRANAWGCVVALYFLVAGVNGLQLLGAGGWVQDVFNGTALVVGVGIVRLLARRTSRGAA